jgi:iron-sulfur cluster assembly protein
MAATFRPRPKVVTLPDAAADRVRQILAKAERPVVGLRVGVKNGGCAGMEYTMEWAEEQKPFDEVVEDKGVKVLIDAKAIMFLLGTEMDVQSARRMFGGAGVFRDGLMFALIINEVLYLKADEATEGDFKAEGLSPFTYETKRDTRTVMSYWRAPERCLDDPDDMTEWCRKAYAVALKTVKPKKKR